MSYLSLVLLNISQATGWRSAHIPQYGFSVGLQLLKSFRDRRWYLLLMVRYQPSGWVCRLV